MCNGQKPLSHTNHWDYDKTKKRIKAGKEFPEAKIIITQPLLS